MPVLDCSPNYKWSPNQIYSASIYKIPDGELTSLEPSALINSIYVNNIKDNKMTLQNTDKSVPNLLTLGFNLAAPSLIIGAAIAVSFNDTIKHIANTSSVQSAPWNKLSILSAALTMREVNNAVNNDDYTILGLLGAKAYSTSNDGTYYYVEDGDGAPISMLNVLSAIAAMVLVLYFYHKNKVTQKTNSPSSLSRTSEFS
jgi:hypothetical protein